jgi:hypothetical protein
MRRPGGSGERPAFARAAYRIRRATWYPASA